LQSVGRYVVLKLPLTFHTIYKSCHRQVNWSSLFSPLPCLRSNPASPLSIPSELAAHLPLLRACWRRLLPEFAAITGQPSVSAVPRDAYLRRADQAPHPQIPALSRPPNLLAQSRCIAPSPAATPKLTCQRPVAGAHPSSGARDRYSKCNRQ
jgi:hypothetical protein